MRRLRPGADDGDVWEDKPLLPDLSVYEAEAEPEDTGLLDHHGRPLYRFPERRPIGFIHFPDE